jgi:hypothetical protein
MAEKKDSQKNDRLRHERQEEGKLDRELTPKISSGRRQPTNQPNNQITPPLDTRIHSPATPHEALLQHIHTHTVGGSTVGVYTLRLALEGNFFLGL